MKRPLFLRSLHLLGFKTFARPTEIRFEGGVTAIVGPNGSGKTNIVDSVKWVLGSGQARDLRGRKMEEVIYAGGERRSRAAFAEVSVVFDNTAGRLPVDYAEVAITRRVQRDGESDYFLNGTRVRRRDLLHLLASTGLTVDSYAIIDQRDIESIVVCTPAERRQLLEEAAQVRGVKTRRHEASQRLAELAQNLLRLEDLKSEIEPRLEVLRAQASTAREAAEASARLEVLRGSILWEEWREVRDSHRRASSQAQSLDRRLTEARDVAATAEREFQAWRAEVQAAQDRRLSRQRTLGERRLNLSQAEHAVQMAFARAENERAIAATVRQEEAANTARETAARSLQHQLVVELEQAKATLETMPAAPALMIAGPDPKDLHDARREADQARRAAAAAASTLAGLRTRREFLEQQLNRVEPLAVALGDIAAIESDTAEARRALDAAQAASTELTRLTAELEGLESLYTGTSSGTRLGDVIHPEAGYEKALAAVLGPLAEAFVAPDAETAISAATAASGPTTVLYPVSAAEAAEGSLLARVRVDAGYEGIARSLLGDVVIGRDVTLEGVYHVPGLVRAGDDGRVSVAARRAQLRARIAELEPVAATHDDAALRAHGLESKLSELRARAAEAGGLAETRRLLDVARGAEESALAKLGELEAASAEAEERSAAAERDYEARSEEMREHRVAAHQVDAERVRWRDRIDDLGRRLHSVRQDLVAMTHASEDRTHRLAAADAAAAAATDSLPALEAALEAARADLADAETESPEEEAEMAEGARKLVALEEARIDARLRTSTLEGNLDLINREVELLGARMEEMRARMPDGVAPEDIPGGKAREREMRALERRLEEIGPTNALADSECRELEERYANLHQQLEDITAARTDLETLIEKLRAEEESRYDAVFGAVAMNFQEYFSQLAPGGRATLRHAEGDDGPRSGVEILVQPPKKRLQNVTLLSSGERSLAALALVLALDEVNPSPFTILDEVDAALDDANVGRFGEMLARLGRQRQFLVITHNHVTMSHASTLYGIHLDESGTSHLVSVRLEDVRVSKGSPRTHGEASEFVGDKPIVRHNPAARAAG
ncbi:MAG TPA: AAA family ATPase [Candidatus Dormibacteraeota bacterium]|nr:AAA family ATPase [Candidatus Dormibacteraeota bacterium]